MTPQERKALFMYFDSCKENGEWKGWKESGSSAMELIVTAAIISFGLYSHIDEAYKAFEEWADQNEED